MSEAIISRRGTGSMSEDDMLNAIYGDPVLMTEVIEVSRSWTMPLV